jgi:4-carboxymuconolactone decarboxylase
MVSLYDHNPRSNCTSAEKGLEIQRQILGDCIEQMYAQSPKDQLHIQQYLTANCFGDYLTRKGLDLKTRELLTLSMLAALGGCEPQLAGHVVANLAVGSPIKSCFSALHGGCRAAIDAESRAGHEVR